MPIISLDSLDTGIGHGKFDPVYFLFGDEEFLIDEAVQRIMAAAVDESTRSFNLDVLYGAEATTIDIYERASAYPLMADRRVVIVREIDRTFAVRGKPENTSPFVRYLHSPLPTTVLVMTAATSEFMAKGKAKSPFDLLVDHTTAVHFKKIYDREIPSWLSSRVRSRGREITPEAVELFIGFVGGTLRVLNNEIEKLFTYVEDRKKITADDVRAVVGASRVYNVFELQKAIGTRNQELSIEIADRMLESGESEQLILTMLVRYFTILWRLTALRAQTKDNNELARGVGISPFFINEYLSALSRYPLPRIRNAFELLLDTDVKLKTTRLDSRLAVELMVLGIVDGGG